MTEFPVRFGKYILLDRLASGGMAEVYRGKVTGVEDFSRLVAIKCMLPSLMEDEQFATMFIDEAKIASQLSHANIVQIHELGRINERLYIAMELVQGRDLRHVIKTALNQRTPIPIGFASYVLSKAAEGLDFAHSKVGLDGHPLNLVHRDVSPQNIIVSYDGEVKVADFGIAKAEARATETNAGILKGKFAYMAPEQVRGSKLDRRTDIFALGVVLYETLAGKKLFHGSSDFSVLERVRSVQLPDFNETIPHVPEELTGILSRALSIEPDDRYPMAADFAEALQPLLIENRSIFGAKQASQFMRALFASDVEEMESQVRRYADISVSDCVRSSVDEFRRRTPEAMVFETTFEDSEAKTSSGSYSDVGAFSELGRWNDGHDDDDDEATRALDLDSTSQTVTSQPGIQLGQSVTIPRSDFGRSRAKLGAVFIVAAVVIASALIISLTGDSEADDEIPAKVVKLEPAGKKKPVEKKTPKVREKPKPKPKPKQEVAKKPEPKREPVRNPIRRPKKRNPEKKRPKEPVSKEQFGFVVVKANGVQIARVLVDGREVGYSPTLAKLRIGKHVVKIVPEDSGKREKIFKIDVNTDDTRANPLKLIHAF